MTALERVLALSRRGVPEQEAPAADLVLALTEALDGVRLYLAKSDPDDDGDDDSSGKDDADDDDGGGHSSHSTYKALLKKGIKPAKAAKMCAQSDKKVAASALAESACVILSGLVEGDAGPAPEPSYLGRVVALSAPPGESASDRRSLAKRGHALADGSYPVPDKKHLHSAAVLAASKKGNWKAAKSLIRKRAKELGVELSSLPGFGEEKVEATMVSLAAKSKISSHSTTPKPDAHQLHVAHVKHIEHVAHLHTEHLAHMAHQAHVGK